MLTRRRKPQETEVTQMNATTQTEVHTPELSTEERKMLAEKMDTLDAITLEDAIAYAPRRKKDAAGRTWRMGEGAGKVVRQLFKLWEGKGEADDGSIHKCKREMMAETRLTERKLQGAVSVLVEEGLLETWGDYRNDRRQTTYYLLNLWECFKVAAASEIGTVEGRLQFERNRKHRARLEEKLAGLRRTLSDLELRFTKPERGEHDDFEDIAYCACGECSYCAPYQPEHGGHEDGEVPRFTDEDAPDEDAPVDWMTDGFGTDDPPQVVEVPPASCNGTPTNLYPHPPQVAPPTRDDYTKRLHEVTEESSFTTQTLPSERRLSAPPDVGDEFENEPVMTTSTPSLTNSLDGNGTEEEGNTDPAQTTEPMNAREAWALYESGELTLLEVERLCRPRGSERKVA